MVLADAAFPRNSVLSYAIQSRDRVPACLQSNERSSSCCSTKTPRLRQPALHQTPRVQKFLPQRLIWLRVQLQHHVLVVAYPKTSLSSPALNDISCYIANYNDISLSVKSLSIYNVSII